MGAKKSMYFFPAMIVFFVILLGNYCGTSSPTTPNPPPPPPPVKTYTLQIQYTRTYLNPDFIYSFPYLLMFDSSGRDTSWTPARIDSYHFSGEIPGVKAGNYYFHCYDPGRYDGLETSSSMVGDIFFITIKETGIIKELKDIRPYTLPTNLYPGPAAKAAFFRLTSDGQIISDP